MIEVVKKCKYLLPCGRCDKFNKDCDQNIKFETDPITIEQDQTNQINHEHKWVWTSVSTLGTHYRCAICGLTKVE